MANKWCSRSSILAGEPLHSLIPFRTSRLPTLHGLTP